MSGPRRTVQYTFGAPDATADETEEQRATRLQRSLDVFTTEGARRIGELGLTRPPSAGEPVGPDATEPVTQLVLPTMLDSFDESGRIDRTVVRVAPPEAPVASPQQFFENEVAVETSAEQLPARITSTWRLPFPLRDYQQEALDALVKSHRGSVILPTGAGKSLIAVAAIHAFRVPAVVIVSSLPLLVQWVNVLKSAGIAAGVYYGEEKNPNYVTVSTYQSLYENPQLIRGFPLIVFDEGDLATAERFRAIVEESRRHTYALLLTATPPSDPARRRMLERALPILVENTPRESIERGAIVPVELRNVLIPLTGLERNQYDELDKQIHGLIRVLGTGDPRMVVRIIKTGSQDQRRAAMAYLRRINQRKALLSNAENKRQALLDIVRAHPQERILVFSESVGAIEASCGYLTAAGVGCRVVTGETRAAERQRVFSDWGRDYWVLGSVRVLERGIDVPQVSVAVILASGSGRTQLTQRIGRIVRPSPGKERATIYVVTAEDTTESRVVDRVRTLVGGTAPEASADEEAED